MFVYFSIETLRIQPTLTKDAVFSALAIADVTINPGFEELCLGWRESITVSGKLKKRAKSRKLLKHSFHSPEILLANL